MGSQNLSLAEFHKNLDELCDKCTVHFGELYRICNEDDELTEASKNPTLPPERRAVLEELRLHSYKAAWNSPDIAGLGILNAMESFSNFDSLWNVECWLKSCRESAGYDESTSTCRKALDVFERELQSVHRQLKDRFLKWPRPDMATIMSKIHRMQIQLRQRKLFELCDESSHATNGGAAVGVADQQGSQQRPLITGETGPNQLDTSAVSALDHAEGGKSPPRKPFLGNLPASITWNGQPYVFTPAQASVVGYLLDAREAGDPVLFDADLLERSGSASRSLRDVFRSNGRMHPAWDTMIVKVGRHSHKLSEPKSESPT